MNRKAKLALTSALLSCLFGCSSPAAPTPMGPPPSATCVEGDPLPPSDAPALSRRLILLDHLTFALEEPTLVADGIDLDCRVSDGHDELGCRQVDMVTAGGAEGIDNQFTRLMPLLSAIAETDVVQLQLDASEAPTDLPVLVLDELADGTIEISLAQGSTTDGMPIRRDAAGQARPMQALSLNPSSLQWLGRATPEGSDLELRGGDLALPLHFPNNHAESVLVAVATSRVAVSLPLASTRRGVFAGGVSIDEMMRISRLLGLGSTLDLLQSIYESLADLAPDASGMCSDLSFGLSFDPVQVTDAG